MHWNSSLPNPTRRSLRRWTNSFLTGNYRKDKTMVSWYLFVEPQDQTFGCCVNKKRMESLKAKIVYWQSFYEVFLSLCSKVFYKKCWSSPQLCWRSLFEDCPQLSHHYIYVVVSQGSNIKPWLFIAVKSNKRTDGNTQRRSLIHKHKGQRVLLKAITNITQRGVLTGESLPEQTANSSPTVQTLSTRGRRTSMSAGLRVFRLL